MIRKCLLILSIVGLVLSVGLWGLGLISSLRVFVFNPRSQTCYMLFVEGHKLYAMRDAPIASVAVQGHSVEVGFAAIDLMVCLGGDYTLALAGNTLGRKALVIPLWSSLLIFVASTLVLLYSRARRRRHLGLCVSCGYDLRGSTDQCPECGHARETAT